MSGVIYGDAASNAAPTYQGAPPPLNPQPFFTANTYTHVVWTKLGTQYTFYRNGVFMANKAAPQTVKMNQLYNI